MMRVIAQQTSSPPQAQFQISFVWSAILIAIFAGFAIGAHLAAVIGLDRQLGEGFYSFIQAHGHLQLVGWAGLFIIGVSLHFIPRLAGIPLRRPALMTWILLLVAGGLILRALCHSILPYAGTGVLFVVMSFGVAISGWMELAGILCYAALLVISMRGSTTLEHERPALRSVQPFFLTMLSGWIVYALINAVSLQAMAVQKELVVNQPWDDFGIALFINFVLLPVCFAFSIRLFPLFLRLPAPDWPVRPLALAYLAAAGIQSIPYMPLMLRAFPESAGPVSDFGKLLKGPIILLFVWKLDVLLRRRDPWTVHRKLHPGPERRPTRPGLPDYGEFGGFERLVYSSYLWLVFGAVLEIASASAGLFKLDFVVSTDAIRHTYFVGFITLLILGMSVRMIPGFIQKKQIASPGLVSWSFWLGNAAAIGRIVPLLIPESALAIAPVLVTIAQALFALSGMFGLAAVSCLGWNLMRTARS